jgi:RecA/RadA recombinase
MLSQALRKLVGSASKCNCTLIFINQLRMKVGAAQATGPFFHLQHVSGVSPRMGFGLTLEQDHCCWPCTHANLQLTNTATS